MGSAVHILHIRQLRPRKWKQLVQDHMGRKRQNLALHPGLTPKPMHESMALHLLIASKPAALHLINQRRGWCWQKGSNPPSPKASEPKGFSDPVPLASFLLECPMQLFLHWGFFWGSQREKEVSGRVNTTIEHLFYAWSRATWEQRACAHN